MNSETGLLPGFRQIVLQGCGMTYGLRSNDFSLLEQVASRSIPGARPSSRPPELVWSIERKASGGYTVRCGARKIADTRDRREARDSALDHVKITVAESGRGVFVHAGVVGWKGRAIVLPGRTFSGKTSLVVALLRRGATYYSDEFAVFDSHGCVRPYARPLQIRSADGTVRLRTPQALGARVGAKPLEVGLVVFARYKPDAVWRARHLTPGNSFLQLLANTVCARKRPHEALRFLRRVATGSAACRAERGDSQAAVEEILKLFTAISQQPKRRAS